MSRRDSRALALVVLTVNLLTVAACQSAKVSSSDSPGAPNGATPGGGGNGNGAPGATPGVALPDAGPPAPAPGAMQTCASEVHAADKVPVDLLLLVDASGSMDELSGAETKWTLTREALRNFVIDPASAGLGVGLTFFPSTAPGEMRACQADADCAGLSDPVTRSCRQIGVCFAPGLPLSDRACAPGLVTLFNCPAGMQCRARGRCANSGALCVEGGTPCPGGDTCKTTPGECRVQGEGCNLSQYGKLEVDIGDLPAQAPALQAALAGRQPDGSTPMTLAAESALTALAARAKTHPNRRAALVLATDGLPSGCGQGQNVDTVAARLQQARSAAPSIPTYVVGVFAADEIADAQPALERFATVGGTDKPFILATGADLNQRLLEALKTIRGQAVSCEYNIPAPQMGALDLGKVNVRTSRGGQTVDLSKVPAADRCLPDPDAAGWYYETVAGGGAPSRLVICPATCDKLRADPSAKVELVFGCATRGIE